LVDIVTHLMAQIPKNHPKKTW